MDCDNICLGLLVPKPRPINFLMFLFFVSIEPICKGEIDYG